MPSTDGVQARGKDGLVQERDSRVTKTIRHDHSDSQGKGIEDDQLLTVIRDDPYLRDHQASLNYRYNSFRQLKANLEKHFGSLTDFSCGHKIFGFTKEVKTGNIIYREWAPNAEKAFLIGDFNNWSTNQHPMSKNDFGVWEIILKRSTGNENVIAHGSKVKVMFILPSGQRIYRIPAWIRRVEQQLHVSPVYDGIYWDPPNAYSWKNKKPERPETLRIYEAHVGISSPEPRCATYDEFRENVIPRIVNLGYNTIQLMAIMEHPYYASFGYQVSSFFAASSRYGTPEALKRLIDEAHGHGLTVLLDLVHSHSANNTDDGLNFFDGSDHLYFHGLPKGRHELWDSRLFNYANYEVLRFLLSNCRYWAEEFQFDGFRFDGITSMMYHHHGIAWVLRKLQRIFWNKYRYGGGQLLDARE